MAKFDQGGGCPCGLQKVCDCDVENPPASKRTAQDLQREIEFLRREFELMGYEAPEFKPELTRLETRKKV